MLTRISKEDPLRTTSSLTRVCVIPVITLIAVGRSEIPFSPFPSTTPKEELQSTVILHL
jgi:hypothetical protein